MQNYSTLIYMESKRATWQEYGCLRLVTLTGYGMRITGYGVRIIVVRAVTQVFCTCSKAIEQPLHVCLSCYELGWDADSVC